MEYISREQLSQHQLLQRLGWIQLVSSVGSSSIWNINSGTRWPFDGNLRLIGNFAIFTTWPTVAWIIPSMATDKWYVLTWLSVDGILGLEGSHDRSLVRLLGGSSDCVTSEDEGAMTGIGVTRAIEKWHGGVGQRPTQCWLSLARHTSNVCGPHCPSVHSLHTWCFVPSHISFLLICACLLSQPPPYDIPQFGHFSLVLIFTGVQRQLQVCTYKHCMLKSSVKLIAWMGQIYIRTPWSGLNDIPANQSTPPTSVLVIPFISNVIVVWFRSAFNLISQ